MNNLQEQLMDREKKIEELVRMGLMPVHLLPWLKRGLEHVQQDAFLPLVERKIVYLFMNRIMAHVFDDQLIYRLVRQRTAMNKYEEHDNTGLETIAEEGPDLKKAPEGSLLGMARSVETKKRAGGKVSDADKKMASKAKAELRRRRDNLNKEDYEKAFNTVLNSYNVSSIANLSQEDIKDFLTKVDEIFNSNSGE